MVDILFPERLNEVTMLQKLVVYDFAVDGGAVGTHSFANPTTFPDKAVINVVNVDIITAFTSATDAFVFTTEFPTDGQMTGPNGAADFTTGPKGKDAISATPLGGLKLTAARALTFTVTNEDITAGKAVFQFTYFISQ